MRRMKSRLKDKKSRKHENGKVDYGVTYILLGSREGKKYETFISRSRNWLDKGSLHFVQTKREGGGGGGGGIFNSMPY